MLKSTFNKYDFPEVERFNKHINVVLESVAMLQIITNAQTNLIASDTNRNVRLLSAGLDRSLQENRAFQDLMLGRNGKLHILDDAVKSGFEALAQGAVLKFRWLVSPEVLDTDLSNSCRCCEKITV